MNLFRIDGNIFKPNSILATTTFELSYLTSAFNSLPFILITLIMIILNKRLHLTNFNLFFTMYIIIEYSTHFQLQKH